MDRVRTNRIYISAFKIAYNKKTHTNIHTNILNKNIHQFMQINIHTR
jgi:hypothetical protein